MMLHHAMLIQASESFRVERNYRAELGMMIFFV